MYMCTLKRLQNNSNHRHSIYQAQNNHQNNKSNHNRNIYMVVQYTKGLRESLKNVCSQVGVQVHFKGDNTIKNILGAPKDRDNPIQKVG